MPTNFLRFEQNGTIRWGEMIDTEIVPLKPNFSSTAQFVEALLSGAVEQEDARVSWEGVSVLSPVTADARIVCQFTNYRTHVREAGRDPDKDRMNIVFGKASSSLGSPHGQVIRPAGVRLLDYEVEIGLVIGRRIEGPTRVAATEIHQFVAGLVIANDLSARDIQVPEQQAYRGKSFRGFTPCGPFLTVLDQHDWERFEDLHLRLSVDGQVRQDAYASEMRFKPSETITMLSEFQDLFPGDLILTGTPGGTAIKAPPKFALAISKLLPQRVALRKFLQAQAKNDRYLRPGQLIEATISTNDGFLDLGTQRIVITAPKE